MVHIPDIAVSWNDEKVYMIALPLTRGAAVEIAIIVERGSGDAPVSSHSYPMETASTMGMRFCLAFCPRYQDSSEACGLVSIQVLSRLAFHRTPCPTIRSLSNLKISRLPLGCWILNLPFFSPLSKFNSHSPQYSEPRLSRNGMKESEWVKQQPNIGWQQGIPF